MKQSVGYVGPTIDELALCCKRLRVSQEIKEVVEYLLKNREALKCSTFDICTGDSQSVRNHIFVQLPWCTLSFAQTLAKVTIENEVSYWFVPHGIKHFFETLDRFKKVPEELEDVGTQLKLSQELKEVVTYLFKNREALKCSPFDIYLFGSSETSHVCTQLPGCALSFVQTFARVTLEEQPSFWFTPHSIKHFFEVLDILKRLPRELNPKSREEVVATAETYPGVPIEEILVLLTLKLKNA